MRDDARALAMISPSVGGRLPSETKLSGAFGLTVPARASRLRSAAAGAGFNLLPAEKASRDDSEDGRIDSHGQEPRV